MQAPNRIRPEKSPSRLLTSLGIQREILAARPRGLRSGPFPPPCLENLFGLIRQRKTMVVWQLGCRHGTGNVLTEFRPRPVIPRSELCPAAHAHPWPAKPQSADNEDGFRIKGKTIGNLRCGNFLSGNAPCHEGWSKRQEVTAGRVV